MFTVVIVYFTYTCCYLSANFVGYSPNQTYLYKKHEDFLYNYWQWIPSFFYRFLFWEMFIQKYSEGITPYRLMKFCFLVSPDIGQLDQSRCWGIRMKRMLRITCCNSQVFTWLHNVRVPWLLCALMHVTLPSLLPLCRCNNRHFSFCHVTKVYLYIQCLSNSDWSANTCTITISIINTVKDGWMSFQFSCLTNNLTQNQTQQPLEQFMKANLFKKINSSLHYNGSPKRCNK